MGHDYHVGKKIALKTILILGVITVVEVLIALTGKGYIISGFHLPIYIMGLVMIAMSMYKAYLIVFEFMHMRHEVRGLRLSVLLPTLLLIWAIIAFIYEGSSWKGNRDTVQEKGKIQVEKSIQPR